MSTSFCYWKPFHDIDRHLTSSSRRLADLSVLVTDRSSIPPELWGSCDCCKYTQCEDNTSIDNSASVSATLYHIAPSLVYKTPKLANACARRSTTVDHCRSDGTHASVNVSADGFFASHLNILIMKAVSAIVHRIYRVSHRLSEIQPRMIVDALLISSVRLGIIWMIALASVCLGLVNLNAKVAIVRVYK